MKELINYDEIIKLIELNFQKLIQKNPLYRPYDISICNEQYYDNLEDLQPNTIYIIVKFSSAEIDFGVTVLPLSFTVVSEEDRFDVCKILLEEYVIEYNQEDSGDMQQYYDLPNITSNFNEVYAGFRTFFNVSAAFVISKLSNRYTIYWKNGGVFEEIKFLTSGLNVSLQNNPQLFFSNNNYTKSLNTGATCVLTINSYFLNNDFYNKCIEVWEERETHGVVNGDFTFKIVFRSKTLDNTKERVYKMASLDINQEMKKIPSISLSFTN